MQQFPILPEHCFAAGKAVHRRIGNLCVPAELEHVFVAVAGYRCQGNATVQIGLGMLQGAESTDFRPVMAGAMIILLPSILAFIIGQKQLISGLTSGSVKG